jgi:hypothetical protein
VRQIKQVKQGMAVGNAIYLTWLVNAMHGERPERTPVVNRRAGLVNVTAGSNSRCDGAAEVRDLGLGTLGDLGCGMRAPPQSLEVGNSPTSQ